MFSYGFYNSLNGDRKYNAEQMSSIFDGVIVDGIFENVGEIFATVPGAGLEVIVKTGRAWFKHTWSLNDTWMPLALSEPDVYRNRIDAVVLEVNHDINVRKNELKIVEGEPAVVGVKPTMIHNENVDQYALAYVTVKPFATSILEEDIEIMVGRGDVPFVTCPLKTIPITDLFNQWNGEFSTWFNNLKAQLTDNVVTNLQSQITANKEQLDDIQTTLDGSLPLITDGMGAGSLFMVSKYYKETITDALLCNGGQVSGDAYPELASILGLSYGGSVGSDSVNTQYGITTTYGYPQAYNPDKDFFVTASVKQNRLVIYRKNQTPQVISIPSTAYKYTPYSDDNLMCYPIGNIILVVYFYNYNTSSSPQLMESYFTYDITTGTFVGSTSNPVRATITNSKPIDMGDYIVAACGNFNAYAYKNYKNDPLNGITFMYSGHGVNSTYSYSMCDSYDPDYMYMISPCDSSKYRAFRFSREDLSSVSSKGYIPLTQIGSDFTSSSGTFASYPILYFDGYFYIFGQGGWSKPLNGTVATRKISDSSFMNARIYQIFQLSEDTALAVFNSTITKGLILKKGEMIQINLGFSSQNPYATLHESMLVTSTGARNNMRVTAFQLPTITQSEALVYIRTKTPKKEA